MRDSFSSSAVMRAARGPAAGPGAGRICLRAERRRRVSGRVLSRGRDGLGGWGGGGGVGAVGAMQGVFASRRCEAGDAAAAEGVTAFRT